MHAFAERVSEDTTSTSTSTIILGGAIDATYNRFVDRFDIGQQNISVRVEDDGGWLAGLFTLTDANTLTRTEIIDSSAAGADVTLSGANRTVACVLTAHRAAQFVAVDATAVSAVADTAAMSILVIEGGVAKKITVADFIAALGVAVTGLPAASALADANGIVVVQGGAETLTTLGALKSYIGVPDTTAPTAVSAAVANATPTRVDITMSEPLSSSYVPAASSVTISGHTVSSIAVSGSTLQVTVSSAFVYGEAARTAAYTQPGTNNLRDAAGNLLANFSGLAITNNVGDSTAPTASSAAVANATPTVVAITMSEAMDAAYVPAASAWAVSGHTVSGVAISGSTINLTVTAAFVNGEAARTVSYTQPGTNNARDAAGNLLANFSGLSITNNVQPSDTTAPTFVSAQVANAAPANIVITMSETMAAVTPVTSAFTASGGKTVTGVSISGSTVTVTVNSAYSNGAATTVAYTKPGSGNVLQDPSGNQTATFGAQSVTNNISSGDTTAPTFVSAAIAQGAPTVITVTMSEALGSEVPQASAFVVTGAGMGTTVSSVGTPSGTTFTLTLSAAVEAGSVVTLAYNKPGSGNQIKDAVGNAAATWSAQSVANNQTTVAYTIALYSGNSWIDPIDGTTPTNTFSPLKLFGPAKQSATIYFSVNATSGGAQPTSARMGWSTSNTVPPELVTSGQNASGGSSVNGLVAMTKATAFGNQTNLWVPVGAGTTVMYPWIKPLDGVPQCIDMSGTTINNA